MSSGFFNPKGPTYDDTVVPTFNNITINFEGVDNLDKVTTVNKTKNENRIRSIIEEDMGIHTSEWLDDDGETQPADLPMTFTHDADDDVVAGLISGISKPEEYFHTLRIIRMLYQNLYDEGVIYSRAMDELKAFTEKLVLDPTTPWILTGDIVTANFPVLTPPYPDNDTTPDTDYVYRNMVAHLIRKWTGINIISNDFLWITHEYFPSTGTATHWRMNFIPDTEERRQLAHKFVEIIGEVASGVSPAGIINPYRYLHFAGAALEAL